MRPVRISLGIAGVGWHTVQVDCAGVPADLVAAIEAVGLRRLTMAHGELSMERQVCEWRLRLDLPCASVVEVSFFDDGPIRPGVCGWFVPKGNGHRVTYRRYVGRR